MIQLIKIQDEQAKYFKECWSLYQEAFPEEERREKWYHLKSMESRYFNFEAIIEDSELKGLIGWWDFEQVRYIEHVAVLPELRSKGYGKKIFTLLKSISPKPIILEVEPPKDEISKRRIGFYRREGFMLNPHYHLQPPYQGDKGVNLLIMSYPEAITQEYLEQFRNQYFPLIHFRHQS
ncbi:MAG: GNAT family N-acetyltransferase [Rikenellaceae bacterium]